MERVKRLSINKIKVCVEIPTSNLWQVTYRWTKGITYVVITVRPIKMFIEYVGSNMGIQVPLLVIDQRGVSIMST